MAVDAAKQAVTAEYLALYEYHCDLEQLERNGEPALKACNHPAGMSPEERATAHHEAALQLLWSMDAEAQDPLPPGLTVK